MHEHAPASKENWDTNVFIHVQVQLDVSFLNIHILDKNLSFLFAQLISDIQFFFSGRNHENGKYRVTKIQLPKHAWNKIKKSLFFPHWKKNEYAFIDG